MFSFIGNIADTAQNLVEDAAHTATQAVTDAVHTGSHAVGNALHVASNPLNTPKLVTNLVSDVVTLTKNLSCGSFKTVEDLLKNIPTLISSFPEIMPFKLPINELISPSEIENEKLEFYKTLPPSVLEDAKLLVPNLIAKYGYPSEIHTISTEDGYNLALHRIPHGQAGATPNRRVILLVHTILSSSADFVVPGPKAGLAYLLADAGYDVWLANCRGNRYSRHHNTLNPNDAKFWDFSFNEIGIYDCPAMIDYILNETKQSKLYYIGHGQGNTAACILLSEKPEYNDKIAVCVSLAPMEYMHNVKSPLLRFISHFSAEMKIVSSIIGENEFLPNDDLLCQAARFLSANTSPAQILCSNAMFVLCGYTPDQINTSILPVIMGHSPAGCSTKQVLHFIQEVHSGKFGKWDYGTVGNKANYGNEIPPDYTLANITCPIIVLYSNSDWLSDVADVGRLLSELTSVKEKAPIELTGFNNLDYLYGIDAPVKIYEPLINKIANY